MTNNSNIASNNNNNNAVAVAVFGKKVGMGDWVEFFIPSPMGRAGLAALILKMKVSDFYEEEHGWVVSGSLPEGGEWVWVPRCGEERRYKVTL